MPETRVTILGAGLMGSGIAQVFAAAGHPVAVFDPDAQARLTLGDRVDAAFRLVEIDRRVGGPVTAHDNLADAVAGAAIVIEAGPEDLAVKRDLFRALASCAAPDAILATNTSALPVSRISDGVPTRERILGMHFWNPPYLVPLVEVVQGRDTHPQYVAKAIKALRDVEMEPVHVRADVPGFIGNRLQHALKREAIALAASGVCSAEDIDTVVKKGFGLRLPFVGPLEQSDLVGLGLTLQIHETIMPDLDRTPEPHPYLVELVREGKIGAIAGQGFRTWTPDQAVAAREQMHEGLRAAALERRRQGMGGAPRG